MLSCLHQAFSRFYGALLVSTLAYVSTEPFGVCRAFFSTRSPILFGSQLASHLGSEFFKVMHDICNPFSPLSLFSLMSDFEYDFLNIHFSHFCLHLGPISFSFISVFLSVWARRSAPFCRAGALSPVT